MTSRWVALVGFKPSLSKHDFLIAVVFVGWSPFRRLSNRDRNQVTKTV